MPTVTSIILKDLKADKMFGPSCSVCYGVCNDTIKDGAPFVVGIVRTDSDTSIPRHYHANCNMAQYKLEGNSIILLGPDQEEVEFNRGDWLFVPKGETYGVKETGEPYEVIFCYVGVSSKEEAGTVFIEQAEAGQQRVKTKAKVIREQKDDWEYAAPLYIGFGIDNKIVENPGILAGTSYPPPGAWNRRHYHANADVQIYWRDGGVFNYYPRFTEHGTFAPEPRKELSSGRGVVFFYHGVECVEDMQKIYVEPPKE